MAAEQQRAGTTAGRNDGGLDKMGLAVGLCKSRTIRIPRDRAGAGTDGWRPSPRDLLTSSADRLSRVAHVLIFQQNVAIP